MRGSDSTSAPVYTAPSAPASAKAGKWAQLTGVYDSGHQSLTLYVNGVQTGQLSGVPPWSGAAPGPLRIGNAFPGGAGHAWDGKLSDACVFYGPLPATDVSVLYSGSSAHPHNGCAALYSLYP